MLRELGPENPLVEGEVLIIGAMLFIICGLYWKRIVHYAQKRSGHSDRVKEVGIVMMRPLIFTFAVVALVFAYMFLTGRWQ
jgi:hypothetical protein